MPSFPANQFEEVGWGQGGEEVREEGRQVRGGEKKWGRSREERRCAERR